MVRRKDPGGGSRIRRAAIYFGVAMTGVLASTMWVILTPNEGQAEGWPAVAVVFFLLLVFGTVVNVFRVILIYRCPKCRAWIARVPGAVPGDPVLYRCSACKVEWDTGWTVAASGD